MTSQVTLGAPAPAAAASPPAAPCRFCGEPLQTSVIDLGMSPLCESYVGADRLNQMEPFYPLHVYVCDACLLVQVEAYVPPESIFTDYAYFSSYSDSWLEHARRYVDEAVDRYRLGPESLVVELGSNDGYLLQYVLARGVPALGVEPAANVAAVAAEKGIPTRVAFFGTSAAAELVAEGKTADLVIGNNVLAQVPDLNDFVVGIGMILKPDGVATVEFPHLLRLIEGNQFDTIYHEHFSYFSLLAARRIFAAHGLTVVDVEEVPTHGGSLRLVLRREGSGSATPSDAVHRVLRAEEDAGLADPATYGRLEEQARETKRALLEFLIDERRAGRSIVAYGAAGKGNTLLNYCGIGRDFIDYVVDRNPHKQGRFLPGTHIPIHHPDRLAETRPDLVLILPWNLRDEIAAQLADVRSWGGRLAVPIPTVEVIS